VRVVYSNCNVNTNIYTMDKQTDSVEHELEGASGQTQRPTRTLSEKGLENYNEQRDKRLSVLEKAKADLDLELSNATQHSDAGSLRQAGKDIVKLYDRYQTITADLLDFLARAKTDESKKLADVHTNIEGLYQSIVQTTVIAVDNHADRLLETASVTRHSSRASKASNLSSTSAERRSRADAARFRAACAQKEAEIRRMRASIDEEAAMARITRRRAELEVDLDLLQHEKEEAEAYVDDADTLSLPSSGLRQEDVRDRTEYYVSQHSIHRPSVYAPVVNGPPIHGPSVYAPVVNGPPIHGPSVNAPVVNGPPIHGPSVYEPVVHGSSVHEPFVHRSVGHGSIVNEPIVNEPMANMFSNFMIKKDLLLSRLVRFTDEPELFDIWRSSFRSVTTELGVSQMEELELLAKWLGPESSKHAQHIRAANAKNPELGLTRVWERLDTMYARPEMVDASIKKKLSSFVKISNKDPKRLFDLSDIVTEIASLKETPEYETLLGYYDSSTGVTPIVNKLPPNLQDKWTNEAIKYKRRYQVAYPPFTHFASFIDDLSRNKNDPSFVYDNTQNTDIKRGGNSTRFKGQPQMVNARKTDVARETTGKIDDPDKRCPIHKTKHPLTQCKSFRSKPIQERRELLKEHRICFRCCASTKHSFSTCKETIQCTTCSSERHCSAMHFDRSGYSKPTPSPSTGHGGEQQHGEGSPEGHEGLEVNATCTQICSDKFSGKSCAKTILATVYPRDRPDLAVKVYAILDDQSNKSLAKSELLDAMGVQTEQEPYKLSSCAGNFVTSGRRASGLVIESLDGSSKLDLPTLIECNQIPEIREEIPTPEVAQHHPHLKDIAHHIPPIDDTAQILLLVGRDLVEAHHVFDQRTGPRNSPFAQRLCLGWVIVGEACLGKVHQPDVVNVNKTHTLKNGRTSIFTPCPNNLDVKEKFASGLDCESYDDLATTVFDKTDDDDKPALSREDREFIQLMDKEFYRDSGGNWIAPLPFREPRRRLPNNRQQAAKRAKTLDTSLKKNPTKRQHFVTFMQRIIDSGHAEVAPPLTDGEECWYLPLFGVYHPKKPDQIRGVFDSSSQFEGVSLNNVLLTGPDMVNSLLGVLIRFRKEQVAVTADIQQMFHCFMVRKDHRNFLRFLWYADNDPEKSLIEYRMCVHVFGNSPSPAVATYGLRKVAQAGEEVFGTDMKEFVERNFYVDDGLVSLPSCEQAIDLMKRTQHALSTEGNLRLHKISSNSPDVMKAFTSEDLAKDLKDLDLGVDALPLQRSLGLAWDLKSDTFTFQVSDEEKAYTRRGILSTVNSLYDPLGFVAPVIIQGKLLLRDLMTATSDWDEPLPVEHKKEWEEWRDSLKSLEHLHVPRTYTDTPLCDVTRKEIHVFADASEKAIAAVAYLKSTSVDGNQKLGFLLGKSKVAPKHGHTIPRLELCAAVLAVEIADLISEHLDIAPDAVKFYSDSKVVLGYINNQTRRFFVYVANRVSRIRNSSTPEQWNYIPTDLNPADSATRSLTPAQMESSAWLVGPSSICSKEESDSDTSQYPLVDPGDKELRPEVVTMITSVEQSSWLQRSQRFSSWRSFVGAIALLRRVARTYHERNQSREPHRGPDSRSVHGYNEAEQFIIGEVQKEFYVKELKCIKNQTSLPKDSPILKLNPVIDEQGMLRVGGRLSRAEISIKEKHPLIIPGRHHIAILLIRQYHENVKHQGRHFTEGAVRASGLWITGAKRLIASLIHACVPCRKLRGKLEMQKMSDLPADRLAPGPPFTSVGVDTFGPWSVTARRTRGGQAHAKRWAILFTCLVTRAIHIEVIEDMGASGFINAVRRFISIRGKVTEFRSDRGTNFVGATDALKIDAINVEDGPLKEFLYDKGVVWIFNPPHSSHMGGVWERMIGVTRRILESMMTEVSAKNLTHEVLTTFMAEVCAIVNSRPIVPVSSDPESPSILTPSTLLTQKSDHVVNIEVCDVKDMYRAQWKRVQVLADVFWQRWRREYLHTLQSRRKWQNECPNIRNGDVILLKDKDVHRNEWPVGVVINAISGQDGQIRKGEVRVVREGRTTIYTRPVTEMVVLLPADR
jgi:hypothetical protein